MTIQLPDELEAALRMQAKLRGIPADVYVLQMLERDLHPLLESRKSKKPFETGYGMLAKYGPAPSAEEIDENRRDMFKDFGENF